MLDTCQLCDTPDIETMFVNGVLGCYTCQDATALDWIEPEDDYDTTEL
jgi:hypothetical protein